jgi:hypothetical protein
MMTFLAFAPGAGAAEPLARAPEPEGPVAAPVLRQEAASEQQYQPIADSLFVIQGQYHAERDASDARQTRGSSSGDGPAKAISRAAHSAVSIPSYALAANLDKSLRISASNCPRIISSIVVQNCPPKSVRIGARGSYQSRRIQYQVKRTAPTRPEGAVIRRDEKTLMLQIGGLLGVVYAVFLALWLWVTRLRPRARRGARV